MLQIVASAYVSGLCTLFLTGVEKDGSGCVENSGGQYLQKVFAITSYYGPSHPKFDSVVILPEPKVERASIKFK